MLIICHLDETLPFRRADCDFFVSSQWAHLPPREASHRRFLSTLLPTSSSPSSSSSSPLRPPNPADIPPLHTFSDPAIFVDEESRDAGAWAVIYRGGASSTADDVEMLEMALPIWVLEFLLSGRVGQGKEQVKISFVLEPWKGKGWDEEEKMEEMPQG